MQFSSSIYATSFAMSPQSYHFYGERISYLVFHFRSRGILYLHGLQNSNFLIEWPYKSYFCFTPIYTLSTCFPFITLSINVSKVDPLGGKAFNVFKSN